MSQGNKMVGMRRRVETVMGGLEEVMRDLDRQ